MELIKGRINKVKFGVPAEVDAEVVVSYNDIDLPPFDVSTDAGKSYLEVEIPYIATHSEGRVRVAVMYELQGQEFTAHSIHDVITPYLELWELQAILNTTDVEKCYEGERVARHIINSHCGHDFGLSSQPVKLVGDKGTALYLPRPIIKLDRVVEDGRDSFNVETTYGPTTHLGQGLYTITGSGWFLKRAEYTYETPRTESSSYYSADPIRLSWRSTEFKNDSTYEIYGIFGYETIPAPVREAAAILVEDYSCNEENYRAKYLESMKSADWRIQYNSGAYRRTGNVKADKLLSPYVVFRAKVI